MYIYIYVHVGKARRVDGTIPYYELCTVYYTRLYCTVRAGCTVLYLASAGSGAVVALNSLERSPDHPDP